MKLEVDGMNEARNATSVLCSAYDSFFEAEKKIADFLIEHKAEAAGMTVGELAREVPHITPSALSQHLQKLKSAGLVDGEKQGQYVQYSIQDQRLYAVMAALKEQYC